MTSRSKQAAKDRRDALLYNLRPGERDKIRAFQGGLDPITGEPLKPNANLDHRHSDGLCRGLLNPLTNKRLVEDPKLLRAMLAYLEDPPAVKALGEKVHGILGRAKASKRRKRYGPDGRSEPHPRAVEMQRV